MRRLRQMIRRYFLFTTRSGLMRVVDAMDSRVSYTPVIMSERIQILTVRIVGKLHECIPDPTVPPGSKLT